jgi:UDP-2,4-diacetamido-2,4,6-trideoxy-beta-L-altropyranose hydrolase
MRLAFRVDASLEIGSGHLVRCLSLGQALADLGWQVVYVVRRLDAVAERLLTNQAASTVLWLDRPGVDYNAPLHDAPAHHAWARVSVLQDASDTVQAVKAFDVDWVIVDHYAFDSRWHSLVEGGLGCSIGAIDDLGDRSLGVNLLIDQNWEDDHARKYVGRLAASTEVLFGPRFALLSNAYRQARRYQFSEEVRSIGIFLGGTDVANYSLVALRACLEGAHFAGDIELMVRSTHPHLQELVSYSARWPQVKIILDQPDLASFFARHDLHIGAGGGATWERCCVGVPSVLVTFAENQRRVVDGIVGLGLAEKAEPPDMDGLARSVRNLMDDVSGRQRMASDGPALVDGWGCTRVALALSRDRVMLRRATQEDVEMAYRWRNAGSTRHFFRDPCPVNWDAHVEWWGRTLERSDRNLLIGVVGFCNIGVVRFDLVQPDEVEVSLYLAPELTGLGLGSALLRAARSWVSSQLPKVRRVCADVDPLNSNSVRAFEAAGYSQSSGRSWLMKV